MRISDWSSDVCSSDLICTLAQDLIERAERAAEVRTDKGRTATRSKLFQQFTLNFGNGWRRGGCSHPIREAVNRTSCGCAVELGGNSNSTCASTGKPAILAVARGAIGVGFTDRKSTRLNSSH